MHVRVVTRKNKDGTAVRYLQLTHNEWDAATKTSRPKVLHSFGREDQLDRAAIERLVASLCRLLEPRQALSAEAGGEFGVRRLPRLRRNLCAGCDVAAIRYRPGHEEDAREDAP